MKKILLSGSVVVVVAVLALAAWMSDDIDKCLDSGGAWNAKERNCQK
jgi:hypothetical protein